PLFCGSQELYVIAGLYRVRGRDNIEFRPVHHDGRGGSFRRVAQIVRSDIIPCSLHLVKSLDTARVPDKLPGPVRVYLNRISRSRQAIEIIHGDAGCGESWAGDLEDRHVTHRIVAVKNYVVADIIPAGTAVCNGDTAIISKHG